MYNQRNNQFRSNRPSRGNFSRGSKREKKLNPLLFVNKVTEFEAISAPEESNVTTTSFNNFAISERLKRNIADHGYSLATPIQEQAIPEILMGKDIIGLANTGTGKTAAFLISLLNKAEADRNQRVLIVVPTRELALQIYDEYKLFARGTNLEAIAIVGGANIKRQTYALRHNPHFVIGTPGRLKDLIGRRELNLQLFQNVVLDEADRMVDMGFVRDIQFIISLLPKNRQSLFFSATIDTKAEEILRSFVTNPVTISVKQKNTAAKIDQDIVRVSNKSKVDVLHDLLAQEDFAKVIVFGKTKWGVQKLTDDLVRRGFQAAAIHGNKSQGQRQRALEQFKANKVQILLATDVASRGLDIDDVTHVINYDAPSTYEDYVHRIGRTGRAGKRGIALTFVE